MRRFGVGVAAMLALALSGVGALAQPAPDTVAGDLRLAGSNTIGSQLAPDLLVAYGRQAGLTAVKIEETTDPEEHILVMSAAESARQLRGSVAAHGSGTAFPALVNHTADIGMASRRVNSAEQKTLIDAHVGDPMAENNEHVVSLDGVLVIVNRDNPVVLLTLDQIRQLFNGQIRNWSAIGGRDQPVAVYSRDSKSGTFDTFRSVALGADKLTAGAKLFESSEDLADSVAADPGGIGFVGFAYSRNAKPVTVALACGIRVEPKPFLVRTEEYPLARRLYLYTPDKASALVQGFVRFALSDAAFPIVQNAGFINLLPELAPAPADLQRLRPPHAPARDPPAASKAPDETFSRLARSLAGASRLSPTLRFEFDSAELDARARSDIDRIVAWARAHPDRRLILVGFASGQGTFDYNLDLSAKRTEGVARALVAAGAAGAAAPLLLAAGTLGPVACDDDATKGGRNRRVEVWVR